MADFFVWGVDPHVTHVAFAAVKDDELRTASVKCKSMETPTGRLMELYRRVCREALYLSCSLGRPAAIAVEEPIGRFRSPMLTKACGVAQIALFETLAVPVWTVTPTEWKRLSVGNGRASKEDVGKWAIRAFPPESWEPNAIHTEHEIDALGIATAAATLLGARRKEKVAA